MKKTWDTNLLTDLIAGRSRLKTPVQNIHPFLKIFPALSPKVKSAVIRQLTDDQLSTDRFKYSFLYWRHSLYNFSHVNTILCPEKLVFLNHRGKKNNKIHSHQTETPQQQRSTRIINWQQRELSPLDWKENSDTSWPINFLILKWKS